MDIRHSGYLYTNTDPLARRVDECKLRARGAAAALRHALPNEAYKYEIARIAVITEYCRTYDTLHPTSCQLQSSSSRHPNSIILDSCLSSPKRAIRLCLMATLDSCQGGRMALVRNVIASNSALSSP